MSFFGILNGLVSVFFFSRLTDYFGAKRVYLIGTLATVPCFVLFPVITYLVRSSVERSGGLGMEVWVAVGFQLVFPVIFCLGYGTSISEWLKSPLYVFLMPLWPLGHFRRYLYFHHCSRTE